MEKGLPFCFGLCKGELCIRRVSWLCDASLSLTLSFLLQLNGAEWRALCAAAAALRETSLTCQSKQPTRARGAVLQDEPRD